MLVISLHFNAVRQGRDITVTSQARGPHVSTGQCQQLGAGLCPLRWVAAGRQRRLASRELQPEQGA